MASTKSIEAAERNAAKATRRLEMLRMHDAAVSRATELLKAMKRKDYVTATAIAIDVRESEGLAWLRAQQVVDESPSAMENGAAEPVVAAAPKGRKGAADAGTGA